ncbi:MAG: GNAT family N-acetyltransferase [Clostridiales Family XIII bacterium]|jgi:GNAT superfamily N-acetyltransferase|nr:GNAT family N-acetyltransferase [Clostridiales Family XIII bacterium]
MKGPAVQRGRPESEMRDMANDFKNICSRTAGEKGGGGFGTGASILKLSVSRDYDSLVELFIRNGLEFSAEEEVPTEVIKCWRAEERPAEDGKTGGRDRGQDTEASGALIGGCVLALREEEFIIDGIAVEPGYRSLKLGRDLLRMAAKEAGKRGGKRLFLVAKTPQFFRKYGFVTIASEEGPNFFECFTCPQYKRECFPEVMRLDLDDGGTYLMNDE